MSKRTGGKGPGEAAANQGMPTEDDLMAIGNRQQRRAAAKQKKGSSGPKKGFGAK
jgi:hypothetical protein